MMSYQINNINNEKKLFKIISSEKFWYESSKNWKTKFTIRFEQAEKIVRTYSQMRLLGLRL